MPACEELSAKFAELDTQVLGISVDSSPSHKAFAEKLGITFPLLSDIHRHVSALYNVLIKDQGISARATFIVDKQGIIRYQLVNDPDIRRDVNEFLRIAAALQGQK
ncbi:MAG TPA: redoxin domain-containing protein [Firmicutes bacterium]|nr:redoxin domain-containing protein [Bacillota bacterium]